MFRQIYFFMSRRSLLIWSLSCYFVLNLSNSCLKNWSMFDCNDTRRSCLIMIFIFFNCSIITWTYRFKSNDEIVVVIANQSWIENITLTLTLTTTQHLTPFIVETFVIIKIHYITFYYDGIVIVGRFFKKASVQMFLRTTIILTIWYFNCKQARLCPTTNEA